MKDSKPGLGSESQRSGPTLGVALLENNNLTADYGRYRSRDGVGLGISEIGIFECPATWPVDSVYAIAKGGVSQAVLDGTDGASAGVVAAVRRLAPESDLVITNCGFFWRGWKLLRGTNQTPVLLSALDFLDLALGMTAGPVGVLVHSASSAAAMLSQHPGRTRLRIVGFNDLPSWLAIESPDFMSLDTWTFDSLRDEFLRRLQVELADGQLKEARLLILECTAMPMWRAEIRRLTNVPIFDVMSVAKALLG